MHKNTIKLTQMQCHHYVLFPCHRQIYLLQHRTISLYKIAVSVTVHTSDLCRPCRHGSVVAPLVASWQRYDSLKRGRWRHGMFAVAVSKVIVRRKVIGNGVQRYVRQMTSHRQVDGSTWRSCVVLRHWCVIATLTPAGRRRVTNVIRRHSTKSAIRQFSVTSHQHRQRGVVVRQSMTLVGRTNSTRQWRRAKVYGVVNTGCLPRI